MCDVYVIKDLRSEQINMDCFASPLQTDLRSIGKGFLPADINSGRVEEVILCVCVRLRGCASPCVFAVLFQHFHRVATGCPYRKVNEMICELFVVSSHLSSFLDGIKFQEIRDCVQIMLTAVPVVTMCYDETFRQDVLFVIVQSVQPPNPNPDMHFWEASEYQKKRT